MGKQDIKQLRDRNPEKRIAAIKNLAREKDRSALKQLAIMAGDDPDPDVRELARKAGVFIRQQIGELPPANGKDGRPARIAVDKKNEEAAQRELSAAMSYQINGDFPKATRSLQKALSLNPNLRTDSYFVSLCETISGEAGEDAVQSIVSASQREKPKGLGGLFGGRK